MLDTFTKVGGTVLANACGPCIGQWKRTEVKKGETPASLQCQSGLLLPSLVQQLFVRVVSKQIRSFSPVSSFSHMFPYPSGHVSWCFHFRRCNNLRYAVCRRGKLDCDLIQP